MKQLDIFGNEVEVNSKKELLNSKDKSTGWSYSKMQAFRDCPRSYYYAYYGSKKTKALLEPLKDQLIELAELSNKYMEQGNIIHKTIALYFRKAKEGQIWGLNSLTSFAHMNVREMIIHNRQVRTGVTIENFKFPKPVLKELMNGTVKDELLQEEMLNTTSTCLKNFVESEEYKPIRFGGSTPSSIIEGRTSFPLNKKVDVDGKVDVAYLDHSLIHIVDWKTGKKEIQDTSLQLLVYALWARQLNVWENSGVSLQKAYLADGSLENMEFSETHIERARGRILQDAELLGEMEEFAMGSVREAFAKHVGLNCKNCPFEEICIKD